MNKNFPHSTKCEVDSKNSTTLGPNQCEMRNCTGAPGILKEICRDFPPPLKGNAGIEN